MKRGFTIVEIIVVVSVLAIIVSVAYFSLNNWRNDAATSEVQSDLRNGANAVQNIRNFEGQYPGTLQAAGFRGSDSVTLEYSVRGDGSYCLNGQSDIRPAVQWHIDSRTGSDPLEGRCTP